MTPFAIHSYHIKLFIFYNTQADVALPILGRAMWGTSSTLRNYHKNDLGTHNGNANTFAVCSVRMCIIKWYVCLLCVYRGRAKFVYSYTVYINIQTFAAISMSARTPLGQSAG